MFSLQFFKVNFILFFVLQVFVQVFFLIRLNYISYFLFVFSADIDDLKICYILKDNSNATRDLFGFTVEDSGKSSSIFSHALVF